MSQMPLNGLVPDWKARLQAQIDKDMARLAEVRSEKEQSQNTVTTTSSSELS